MLEAALKVIDAARAMRLVRKGGRTTSELQHLDLARAIDGLRLSIEAFDRETGTAVRDPAPAHKPDFAAPPQLDDEGFLVQEVNLSPEYLDSAPEAVLSQDLAGNPDDDDLGSEPETVVPLPSRKAVFSPGQERHDLGDEGAFFDGDESAADLLLAIDSINDKLAYAVSKVGWSPRLRALAEAARIAQNNMYIEVENGNGFVRVPAHNWGTLTVAIAEAALDQDLSIALPRPSPRHDKEFDHDRTMTPRPRNQ